MCGGSSSTYLIDRVESKSFAGQRTLSHLTVALIEVMPRCCLSLSLTGTILVGARMSLTKKLGMQF